MANPLHDNARSPKKPAKEPEKAPEKPAEPAKEAAAADGAEGDGKGGDADMEMTERKSMFERHEAERKDHHGLNRKAMRDMEARHSKEWSEMLFKQQNEMMPKEGEKPAESAAKE